MRNSWFSSGSGGNGYLEDSILILLHRVRLAAPLVWDPCISITFAIRLTRSYIYEICATFEGLLLTEVTNQECRSCIWGPFTIHDCVVWLHIESVNLGALFVFYHKMSANDKARCRHVDLAST